jgi:hypothetical protein
MKLSELQVREIDNFLRRNGIENSPAFGDFLDHICCMIECKMDTGLSFEKSLEFTLKEFPLTEIKATNLLTLKLINMETNFSSHISLLATIPFVLFGLSWLYSIVGTDVFPSINPFLFVTSVLSMFILLGIGWVKNFPRWSLPAVGFCMFFSAYFMMVTLPDFKNECLGLLAWMPFLITLTICLLLKPSMRPAKQLARKIREEPELIMLILYGFAPFFVSLFFDEIHSIWMFPVALAAIFILSLGLYLFLRSEQRSKRLFSIILSGAFALAITFTASYLYWELSIGCIS